jgi:hypothetical protein
MREWRLRLGLQWRLRLMREWRLRLGLQWRLRLMREWRLRLVLQQRLYLSAVEALGAEVEVAPTVAGGGRSRRGRRRGMVGALCV